MTLIFERPLLIFANINSFMIMISCCLKDLNSKNEDAYATDVDMSNEDIYGDSHNNSDANRSKWRGRA